jgi:hypothetical protein
VLSQQGFIDAGAAVTQSSELLVEIAVHDGALERREVYKAIQYRRRSQKDRMNGNGQFLGSEFRLRPAI